MHELDTLSLRELKQLQKEVKAAIDNFPDREKQKAIAEVEAFAREKGLNPADVAQALGLRSRKSIGVAKYANPADRSQTWTGRGRKPGWVIEALAAGRPMDDLAI